MMPNLQGQIAEFGTYDQLVGKVDLSAFLPKDQEKGADEKDNKVRVLAIINDEGCFAVSMLCLHFTQCYSVYPTSGLITGKAYVPDPFILYFTSYLFL